MMNMPRQPKLTMNSVSKGGARHGPRQVEDQTTPVGVPRSLASNHSDRALAADGNIGASPIPSSTRRPMKPAKLLTMPNAAWATDQPSSEAPRAILLPRRSMIMPIGSWAKA
ncbi:hypothetical protein D3C72_647270 [compost metagenome]